jgi:hypothetical protein
MTKKKLVVLASLSLATWLLVLMPANVAPDEGETFEEKWTSIYVSPSGWVVSLAKGLDIDEDGNVFRQGYEKYFIDGEERQQWVVIKYDEDGQEQWLKKWKDPNPSGGWAQPSAIKADGSGGAYVSGSTWPAHPRGEGFVPRGHIKKYAANGDVVWERDYSVPDPSGQIVGWTTNLKVNSPGSEDEYLRVASTFDDGSWPPGEPMGLYTFNCDSDGDIIEGSENILYDIHSHARMCFDDNGNLYVTGESQPADNRPNPDFITRKFDPDMNLVWEHAYNSPYDKYDWPEGLHVDDYGYVYVDGVVVSDILVLVDVPERGLVEVTQRQAVVLKYDPNGNLLWDALYAAPDTWYNTGLVKSDSEGNAYLNGYHRDLGPNPTWDDVYSADCHLVKFTSKSGKQKWEKLYKSPANDEYGDLIVDDEGNAFNLLGFQNSAFVQKLTPKGKVLWEYSKSDARAYQIVLDDEEENLFINAYSFPPSGGTIMTIRLEIDD